MKRVRLIYKHWSKDKELEVTGTLPEDLNNPASDKFVVQLEDGSYEDVIKSTLVFMSEFCGD